MKSANSNVVAPEPGSSKRINPDSHQVLWLAVALVAFVGCISFMVSFSGLVAVAEWAGLPITMRWTVPIFIDTAILVYSIAVLIHRSRGESTWASWVSLTAFTLVSVLANVGHVLLIADPVDSGFKTWIGAIVAGMAPIGVFAATEELGRLVIDRPSLLPAPLTSVEENLVMESPTAKDSIAIEVSTDPKNLEILSAPVPEDDTSTAEAEVADRGSEKVAGKSADTDNSGIADNLEEPASVENEVPYAVHYLDPSVEEERILSQLMQEHGKDLTAAQIAEATGKSLRTGQRKLKTLQADFPNIFSSRLNAEQA